jgi:hypothetical protein
MCEQIAQVRRKLQRIGTNHILFLDETLKREGDVDNYSLFLAAACPGGRFADEKEHQAKNE